MKTCKAMRDAGIIPNSQEEINFCVEQCPYKEGCVVVESSVVSNLKYAESKKRRALAKSLFVQGKLKKEIASILKVDYRTVLRYLE